MASLGSFLLYAAFVVCSYAAVISVVGARRGSRGLIESGIGAFYLVAALMAVASAVIVNAFLTDDFSIKYVAHYSESAQPLFYKITSYWGGLDGSIMFWVFLLSVFGTCAVYTNRERHRELIPYVVATISAVEMFFLFLMVVHKNPFTTFLTPAAADGKGLNPLLQNYWMAIHPPSLYTGFVGMTIPFAFGIAALITGHLDDSWLRAVRRWTMVSWLFLSFGLTLGMIWAYEVLGWGGYWGWDPVENAGLLPWFTATAFPAFRDGPGTPQHAARVERDPRDHDVLPDDLRHVHDALGRRAVGARLRRGSDPRASVHRLHGGDRDVQLRPGHLPAAAAARAQRARFVDVARSRVPGQQLDSAVLGDVHPVCDDVPDAQRSGHGQSHRGRPAVLQQMDAADRLHPAVPDRRRSAAGVAEVRAQQPARFVRVPGSLRRRDSRRPRGARLPRLGVGAVLRALRVCHRDDPPGVLARRERARGVRRAPTCSRRSSDSSAATNAATAATSCTSASSSIFLGFAGNGYKRDQQMLLKPGQQATIGAYTVRNDGIKLSDDGQKQMLTGYVAVFKGGKQIDTMYPGKSTFHKHEEEPARTDVAIRRTPAEDFYVVMAAVDLATQTMSLEIHINPLVDWIWMGFGVLAFGTGIALLPESTFAFALAKLPAEAAATTVSAMLALALVLGGGSKLSAQMTGDAAMQISFYARTPFEAKMQHEIVCTCGCGHITIAECRKDPCATSHRAAWRGCGTSSIRASRTTRSSRPSSRSTAARKCSARRSTKGSTVSPGSFLTSSAPPGPSSSGSPR